ASIGIAVTPLHIAAPRSILISDVVLAEGAVLQRACLGLLLPAATVIADPLRLVRQQPELNTLVGLEVVGFDDRSRRVNGIRVSDGALVYLIRSAVEPHRPDLDHRARDRQRGQDPQLQKSRM